jgi:hypothetical protein
MSSRPCWGFSKSRRSGRAQTLPTVFSPFGFTLNEKQIPQIIEKNKNLGARETHWKNFFCTQGRCATWLRCAPT